MSLKQNKKKEKIFTGAQHTQKYWTYLTETLWTLSNMQGPPSLQINKADSEGSQVKLASLQSISN